MTSPGTKSSYPRPPQPLNPSDQFNDREERGCNRFVPVLSGNGTKIAPTGDIFDWPPGVMSWIRDKLADHVGDHVVLTPEGAVLVTSSGTESSYPRPPQSLNNSSFQGGELYNITQWCIFQAGELYKIAQWCNFHAGELYKITQKLPLRAGKGERYTAMCSDFGPSLSHTRDHTITPSPRVES